MRKSQACHPSARGTNKSQRSASSSTELSISSILSDFDINKGEEYCQDYDSQRAMLFGESALKFTAKYGSKGNALDVMRDAFLDGLPNITFPRYNITAEYFRFGKVKIGVRGDPELAKIATKAMFAYFIKFTDNEALIGDVQATGSLVQDVADIKNDVADIKNDVADIKNDVADIKKDVADIKKDVADIKKDVADIKNDVADIKNDVADIKNDVADIKNDVADIKNNIDAIINLLTNFIQNAGEHKTQCKQYNKRIDG